jgi:peptide deformylase
MTLHVRLFIDPILYKPCEQVTDFSNLDVFVQEMLLTMDKYKGVGLAANQVGVPRQICMVHLDDKTKLMGLVNPRIIRYSKEKDIQVEGCLSAPGISVKVKRSIWIEVEANFLHGAHASIIKFEGFNARIVQHEIDHLNGKMIIDNKQNIIRK